MGEIVKFDGMTKNDLEADQVLTAAVGMLETAIVIGLNEGGELWFSSSKADGPQVLWLLEQAKAQLLNQE